MIRALWIGAMLAITVLGAATSSGLYLLGNTSPDQKPPAPDGEVARAEEQTSTTAQNPPGSEPTKIGDEQRGEEDVRTVRGSTAAPPKTETAKDERRQLLEALGALTAAHCYQTYLNIGFIADGKAKGTYGEKDAYRLLDSVLALSGSMDRKLEALERIDLDKVDRASLDQMRTVSALLRKQAKELQLYWDTGRDEDAARYESVRKDSWAALSRLTGVGR